MFELLYNLASDRIESVHCSVTGDMVFMESHSGKLLYGIPGKHNNCPLCDLWECITLEHFFHINYF